MDSVKCRARGIDADAARQVLVYSFGAEVTQHLKHKQLIQRVQKVVATTLAKAPLLPVESRSANFASVHPDVVLR